MWEATIKIAILLGGVMTAAAYFVLLERRVAAWVQDRIGPNRVGIPLTNIRVWGLGQPLADGVKFILKENFTPSHVDRVLFVAAPVVIFAAALSLLAVIPFGSQLPAQLWGWKLSDRPIDLTVAPGVDAALIYVFALSSIAVYGVILGGWASNNKYSFLGGLRSSAQLVAYEIPMGLGILGAVLVAGSLNLSEIITAQAERGWLALVQPLGFVVFSIAAFAEAARLPFDLPECEQELVGGYHTEYSGMKLMLFLVAEFLHMITAAMLMVILFLGGWHFPGGLTGTSLVLDGWGGQNDFWFWLQAAVRVLVLFTKVFLVIVFFMLVRWTWPRFRFDQLMSLAWKVMLPLGLVNFVAAACLEQLSASFGYAWLRWLSAGMAWIILVGAWVAVSLVVPTESNRPRRRVQPLEVHLRRS
jgi:NADH-quinone oxidoreductase subunit H